MSEPIVFIARQRIKDGMLGDHRDTLKGVVEFIKSNKPDTVGFLNFSSEDGYDVSLIQVYPDAAAMEKHIQGLGEIVKKSYEVLDILGFEIYGQPNEATLAGIKNLAKPGVGVKIYPHFNGGFLRLHSA